MILLGMFAAGAVCALCGMLAAAGLYRVAYERPPVLLAGCHYPLHDGRTALLTVVGRNNGREFVRYVIDGGSYEAEPSAFSASAVAGERLAAEAKRYEALSRQRTQTGALELADGDGPLTLRGNTGGLEWACIPLTSEQRKALTIGGGR